MNDIKQLAQIALDYIDLYEASTMNDLNSSDYYPGLYQQKEDLREECERERERVKKLTKLPKAKWILSPFQNEEENANDNYAYECSNCGYGDIIAKNTKVPYCWHCGAKMEEDIQHETIIEHWLDDSDELPPIGGFHD